MSLTSTDPTALINACNKQPNYYIEDNPSSEGVSCYNSYQKTQTTAQNQAIGLYCSNFKQMQVDNVNFNNCILNWKDSPMKKNWVTTICQNSSIHVVPDEILPNVYEYNASNAVPGIFCQKCRPFIATVFPSLSEKQKQLIDNWVSANINSSFITPALMSAIQEFKKLRITEMYTTFQEKQGKASNRDMTGAASQAFESFKGVFPYLLIIIVCIVCAVFMSRFYGNIKKMSELGKTENQ